jgi:hypothetical protein
MDVSNMFLIRTSLGREEHRFTLAVFFVFPEDKTRPGLCLKAAAHLFSEAGLQGAQIEVTASFLQCFGSTLWKWETAAKPSHRKCWIPGSYFV